jgi:hypothetical protein
MNRSRVGDVIRKQSSALYLCDVTIRSTQATACAGEWNGEVYRAVPAGEMQAACHRSACLSAGDAARLERLPAQVPLEIISLS